MDMNIDPLEALDAIGFEVHSLVDAGSLRITEVPQPVTVDITPESLKTPEGVAKVNAAVEAYAYAQADTANACQRFLKQYGAALVDGMEEWPDFRDELEELQELCTRQQEAQSAFLLVLASRPGR